MANEQPIGVFDSGVGGLTVAQKLMERMPQEAIIYFGDTAHIPYGGKSVEQLLAYATAISRFLLDEGVKLIVAACNTSSAVSLEALREMLPVPVIGVIEPGVRRAVAASVNRKIGVLATEATARSGAFPRCLAAYCSEAEVVVQACPRLVPMVESGQLEGEAIEQACAEYLAPLLEQGVDTIILGCTHYPFLLPIFTSLGAGKVTFIDPSAATAEDVSQLLTEKQWLRPRGCRPRHRFLVSGSVASFRQVGRVMLGEQVEAAVSHPLEEND